MTNRDLVVFLQEQISTLTATITSLTQEVAALKAALLEKDKDADKLKRFAGVNLPKKTENAKIRLLSQRINLRHFGTQRTGQQWCKKKGI